ncbi:MAG TPA: hypothetical protein VMV48_03850 [Gallionellaceae bacterium]|nr:hypothetical protein [Gallionellaceae bacterium]
MNFALTAVMLLVSSQNLIAKPQIPQSESECVASGGSWTELGLSYPGKPKVCDVKSTDFGKSCTSSIQCEGVCVAPDDAIIGTTLSGACSRYLIEYGCFKQVENSKVESLCVD